MTQLILDVGGLNVVMPESRNSGYTVQKEMLSVDLEMITGRMVRELRGNVWRITYQHGYLDEEMKNKVILACEKGKVKPIECGFLLQENGTALEYSDFFVVKFSRPTFLWGKRGGAEVVPLWGNFTLELREVNPHD